MIKLKLYYKLNRTASFPFYSFDKTPIVVKSVVYNLISSENGTGKGTIFLYFILFINKFYVHDILFLQLMHSF